MHKIKSGKCRHCNELYKKHPRNVWHQNYCAKVECRNASKKESQRRWLGKAENQNYFRGAENVERVRAWRKLHPKYWQRKKQKPCPPLQDVLNTQPVANQEVKKTRAADALQDVLLMQDPLVVGLISMVTGDTLQENIDQTTQKLISLGYHILGLKPQNQTQGNIHENQTCSLSSAIT